MSADLDHDCLILHALPSEVFSSTPICQADKQTTREASASVAFYLAKCLDKPKDLVSRDVLGGDVLVYVGGGGWPEGTLEAFENTIILSYVKVGETGTRP